MVFLLTPCDFIFQRLNSVIQRQYACQEESPACSLNWHFDIYMHAKYSDHWAYDLFDANLFGCESCNSYRRLNKLYTCSNYLYVIAYDISHSCDCCNNYERALLCATLHLGQSQMLLGKYTINKFSVINHFVIFISSLWSAQGLHFQVHNHS